MSPLPQAPPADRAWDSMVLDLLILVHCNLPCIADRASFAAVCRRWRSTAARLSETTAPPAQLPWVVFPSPAIGSAFTTVFCLLSGATRRITLPADLAGAHLCGSHPGGWLAAAARLPGGRNMASNLFSPTSSSSSARARYTYRYLTTHTTRRVSCSRSVCRWRWRRTCSFVPSPS
jgi:hypothetical protein